MLIRSRWTEMHIETSVWETSKEDIHAEGFKPKFKIRVGKMSHVSHQIYNSVAMAMQRGLIPFWRHPIQTSCPHAVPL